MQSNALDDVVLHVVTTNNAMEKIGQFQSWLGERHEGNVLGFDTETTGLSPYMGDKVRLIQIGDSRQGWTFGPELHGVALQALAQWEGDWVAHNSRFDINFLRHQYPTLYTPPWTRLHDTMTMAHIDDPTRTRGLKPLSGMLIDSRAETSQIVLEKEMNRHDWTWETIPYVESGPGSSYAIYAALDPVLTCRLHNYFAASRAQFREPYDLEMGTVRCIADMEMRGARVDLQYCDRMVTTIEQYSRELRAWIEQAHGIKNATSVQQCIRRFEELGRAITSRTKGGNPSLDKEQLERFLTEEGLPGNDLAKALLDLRRGEKQIGPYFKNFQSMSDSNDRVHPTIWPVGTRTARMSITAPALQTLPRKDPTVRDAFIPNEGHVLVSCDYNQIEMRLAAHFSRDAGLREAFESENDFFTEVASQAYGERVDKKDPRRQLMKNGCYAVLYGAGNTKIAATAGVSRETMDAVMNAFHTRYPGIKNLQAATAQEAAENAAISGRPYVSTPTGRRMPVDEDKTYAGTNYKLQSHAAEVLKRAINSLDACGYGDNMLLPVHDEMVFTIPKEDADQAMHDIPRIMSDDSYFVPLTADADKMEERWGDRYRK